MDKRDILLIVLGTVLILALFGSFGDSSGWCGGTMYGFGYSWMWMFMIIFSVALILFIVWLLQQLSTKRGKR